LSRSDTHLISLYKCLPLYPCTWVAVSYFSTMDFAATIAWSSQSVVQVLSQETWWQTRQKMPWEDILMPLSTQWHFGIRFNCGLCAAEAALAIIFKYSTVNRQRCKINSFRHFFQFVSC